MEKFLIVIGETLTTSDLYNNRYFRHLYRNSRNYKKEMVIDRIEEHRIDNKIFKRPVYKWIPYAGYPKKEPPDLTMRKNFSSNFASTFLLPKSRFISNENSYKYYFSLYNFDIDEYENDDEEFEENDEDHDYINKAYAYDEIFQSKRIKLFKNNKEIIEISSIKRKVVIPDNYTIYFVIHDNKIYVSNNMTTLKEYDEDIYQINEGLNIEYNNLTNTIFNMISHASIVYEKKPKTDFIEKISSDQVPNKISTNISYEEFLERIQFTNFNTEANFVKFVLSQKSVNNKWDNFKYLANHSENKDFFKGVISNIEAEKVEKYGEIIIKKTTSLLAGNITFYFNKITSEIVILDLPRIDDISIFNSNVFQMILEQLKNVTDSKLIRNVYISNTFLNLTYIDKDLFEKFSGLNDSIHKEGMMNVLKNIEYLYKYEEKRSRILEQVENKKRGVRTRVINTNIAKYNEAFHLMQEYKANKYMNFEYFGEGENETIVLTKKNPGFGQSGHETVKKCKSAIILKSPKKLCLMREMCRNANLVVIPSGVEILENIKEAMEYPLNPNYFDNKPKAFLVIPSTIDVNSFPFFKHPRFDGFYLISDNPSFIEKFKIARRKYNITCEVGEHFNSPIIYVPDIYYNIYGYRSSHKTLLADNLSKIVMDINGMIREKHEIECIRFFEKCEIEYIPSTISYQDLEKFCFINGITFDNILDVYSKDYFDLKSEKLTFDEISLYNMSKDELIKEFDRIKSKLYSGEKFRLIDKRFGTSGIIGKNLNPNHYKDVLCSDPRATALEYIPEPNIEAIFESNISELERKSTIISLIQSNMQRFDDETTQILKLIEKMNLIGKLLSLKENDNKLALLRQ